MVGLHRGQTKRGPQKTIVGGMADHAPGRPISETARRHAIVYDGIVEGWGDESTDIFECLGDRFDYRELMRPVQQ